MSEISMLQAPEGVPISRGISSVGDPIIPPRRVPAALEHFFDRVYDLRPESHLSRLLKILLGDTGVGQVRKRHLYAHLAQTMATRHFYSIDSTFSDTFNLSRLLHERLVVDPYDGLGTPEEWEHVFSSDAAYRNRVDQFVRAIHWGGSPTGLKMAAEAVLGVPCRIIETYEEVDENGVPAPPPPPPPTTYGDLEAETYGNLEALPYGRLEHIHRSKTFGRAKGARAEFVISPSRRISDEEHYALVKVLDRIKPAHSLMTVEQVERKVHSRVEGARAHSPSVYWEIKREVYSSEVNATLYGGSPSEKATPLRRQVFCDYQGEAWSYNADIVSVEAFASDGQSELAANEDVKVFGTEQVIYSARAALASSREILLGRSVSDGMLSASPVGGIR